jgi:streptogramin lyase
MGEIMRLITMFSICFLSGALAFAETNAGAPRTLQDNLALYVCAEGKLVKFDAATGAKLGVFPGPELPADVDVAQDGSLLLTEEDDGVVLRFDPNTGQFDEGFFGETDRLGAPRGIAVEPSGHFFVVDILPESSDILEFDENGDYVEHHPDDPVHPVAVSFEDLACNDSGELFATQWLCFGTETPGVFRSTDTGWELFGETGDLIATYGMAFGPDGDLYVVDEDPDHFGVFRYNGTTGASKGVFGETASNDNLVAPRYCTFGPDGNLYVTEDDDGSVRVFNGPLSPDPGAFRGIFGETAGEVEGPLGLVFGPAGAEAEPPALSVEKIDETTFRVTLENGIDGTTYEVRCSADLTQPFASWQICGTITLEGTATGTLEDNTITPQDSQKFYTTTEQSAL